MIKKILPTFKPTKYLDSFGDLVDILGLDEGLEVILQDLGEEVLQLRAPKVGKDLRPVWGVLSTDTQQTPLRYFPLYLPVRKNRQEHVVAVFVGMPQASLPLKHLRIRVVIEAYFFMAC